MPKHSDFQQIYNTMVKKYGEKKGKQVYYAWLNKHKLDDTKPMPKNLKESSRDLEIVDDVYDLTKLHPDFQAIYDSFEAQDQINNFYSFLDENDLNPTQAFPIDSIDWKLIEALKDFKWKTAKPTLVQTQQKKGKVYQFETAEVATSGNLVTYVSKELERAARTLIGKSPNLNHQRYDLVGNNYVIDAEYSDGKVQGYAYIEDPEINKLFAEGRIYQTSLDGQFRGKMSIGDKGKLVGGLVLDSFAFLTDDVPAGIDSTNINLWESIKEKLMITNNKDGVKKMEKETTPTTEVKKEETPLKESKPDSETKESGKEEKPELDVDAKIKEAIDAHEKEKAKELKEAKEQEDKTKEEQDKLIEDKVSEKLREYNKTEATGKGEVEEKSDPTQPEFDLNSYLAEACRKSHGDGNAFKSMLSSKVIDGGKLREADYTPSAAGSAIPEIWADNVLRLTPSRKSALANAINWHDDIKGKPGEKLYLPTISTVTFGSATEDTAPTDQAPTTSAVAISISERIAGLTISRAVLEDAVPDLFTKINQEIRDGYEWDVDGVAKGWLDSPDTALAGTVLEAGAMAGTVIAKAIGSMRAATQEPYFLIMHPVQEASCLQDSQFVDAAEYGDSSVVRGGKVRTYLGIEVHTSPQITSTGGTYRAYLLGKDALQASSKRDVTLDTDYDVQTRQHLWAATARWGGTIGNHNQVVEVATVD